MLAGLKLGAAAGALGLAIGFGSGAWFGWDWRDGRAAKADRERMRLAEERRIKDADRAAGAAVNFEDERERIRRELLATLPPPALRSPVPQCPAVAVGDVLIPGDALGRLRAAAGEPGADADAGQSRSAMPSGAGAAER